MSDHPRTTSPDGCSIDTARAQAELRTSNPLVQRLRSSEPSIVWAAGMEAADEIERLTQEDVELKFRDSGWTDLVERQAKQYAVAAQERDRLRAALERISRDEFSDEWKQNAVVQEDFENDYWRVVNIAREALGPAQEGKP